ncbi:MAG: hypothetical protein EOP08_08390, partial [Proteobacteria bacterium]
LTQQLAAVGTYSDATTQDLTETVTWSSNELAAATVSNADGSRGLATGVGEGEATIAAALDGISGTALLEVSAAALVSLEVTPAAPSIARGRTQQMVATSTFTDASTRDLTGTVTWSSTAAAVASVSNAEGSRGLVTSLTVGETTLEATLGGLTVSAALTVTPAVLVSIAVTPTNPTIGIGTTQQLAAIGTYSDATTLDLTMTATWSSSVVATATVSNAAGTRGLVTSVAAGVTRVTATSGAIVGTTDLTVDACHVTINEVAVAGPAGANDELVELYNGCAFSIDLKGWRLAYRAAAGGSDIAMASFAASTVMAPASFRLLAPGAYVGPGPVDVSFAATLGGGGGGVGLRDGIGAVGTLRDSVGWGTATNLFVEGTAVAAPSSTQSVSRFPADGTDTNRNSVDFHGVARTPRAPNL